VRSVQEPATPSIVTAGMDGQIKTLSLEDMSVTHTFNLRKAVPGVVHSGVRQLAVSRDARKLLVGTAGGDIVELFVVDGRYVNCPSVFLNANAVHVLKP
jgi:hypothetical protein